MTAEEALNWCADHAIVLSDEHLQRLTYDDREQASAITLRVPSEPLRMLALTLLLLGDEGDGKFSGGLVWLNDWDIWSSSFERVGHLVVTNLRGAEPRSLGEAPGQLLDEHEATRAQALFMQPMLFQWDAHFVPSDGEFFVHCSHHGDLTIVARDKFTAANLRKTLEAGDWVARVAPMP